jgi:hypothetical protein
VIGLLLGRPQTTGFLSTARLGFPAHKKLGQDGVEMLAINGG